MSHIASVHRQIHALICSIVHEYLTAREMADLLRIKERKLYDLVAGGALPVTKVTGKLLFPRNAVMTWLTKHTKFGDITGAGTTGPAEPRPVFAGSHDPLLEWALRTSGAGLATRLDGSADGLAAMKAGEVLAAGIHFHGEDPDANRAMVEAEMPGAPVVLIEWAKRRQGLLLAEDTDVASIADIAGKRVVRRQEGAGSQALFDRLAQAAGLNTGDFKALPEPARSEADVAQTIASGRADTGLGIEAAARQFGLAFVPLATERFDILVWRHTYFEPPFQSLLETTRKPDFAERAEEFGGYDVSATGTVRFNG